MVTSRAEWLRNAGWGVMAHYLADSAEDITPGQPCSREWNRRVDNFDVTGLATQLSATGAGYFMLSVGQNSGYFCAPNSTYDSITGIFPSKCSNRDLVGELAVALRERGLRFIVYLPSGAPTLDNVAIEKLQWQWGFDVPWDQIGKRTGNRIAEFQRNWEAVVRDWSLRWGDKVSGWWFDGCYFPEMYDHPDPPNFSSFAAAARAGNPAAIVAFNPGVMVKLASCEEDYSAGEINDVRNTDCEGPWVTSPEGCRAQFHILTFLGTTWLQGPPRFSAQEASAITRRVVEQGGAITWDVPIEPGGLIPREFANQLHAIGKALA